jgi:hypothetical protein
MGGTTAIGILADSGRVPYYLAGDYVSMMEILNTPYYEHAEWCDITCKSVEDFFSEKRSEQEDSVGRYLVFKDGSMVFRVGGDTSIYRMRKNEYDTYDVEQAKKK